MSFSIFHLHSLYFFYAPLFCVCLFMFSLSSCCILFVMLSVHGALFLCHTSYSFCFYHVVLFSYCSFLFSCCVFFHFILFLFFHLSLLVNLFSCCSIFIFHFFMFHFFHAAFLTVCIVPSTLF